MKGCGLLMAEKCYKCGHDMNMTGTGQLVCPLCHDQRYPRKIYNPAVENELSRAEDLRMQRDFDRAVCIYENILSKDDSNYAAHWGLFLSKYGILYVDDPKTHKRIPNINRIHKISVKDDPDFLKACQKAPRNLGMQYATEGKVIDDWFRQLLHRIANQPPYDIFICYKETNDITRARTDDSYLAHDLYNALKGEGYNVFFANQSIHAGDYEPQIYAAIITAKVMLVVATKKEYAESTWVKNEWSRFNDLINRGENKTIINVYDSNKVDLPAEIASYQAFSKKDINFLDKIKSEISRFVNNTGVSRPDSKEKIYLSRGKLALDNGNFTEARAHFENALNENPQCVDAYLGKLMSDLCVKRLHLIKTSTTPLSGNQNFNNAVKFASPQLKAQLLQYENEVELAIAERELQALKSQLNRGTSQNQVYEIIDKLVNLNNANDIKRKELLKECLSSIKVDTPELFEEFDKRVVSKYQFATKYHSECESTCTAWKNSIQELSDSTLDFLSWASASFLIALGLALFTLCWSLVIWVVLIPIDIVRYINYRKKIAQSSYKQNLERIKNKIENAPIQAEAIKQKIIGNI